MTKTSNALKKSVRSSNIELLRIISIVLILLYHLARNTVPQNIGETLVITSLSSWGILGVNCFVAVSSYFLLDQKFKFSRIASVLVQTVFYGIIFLGIRVVTDYANLGTPVVSNLFELVFKGFTAPFWVTRYWFVWTYMLLCLVSPFLNLFIEKLTRENHVKLLICMSFILIYGTFGNGTGIVCDLAFFVYIYFAVAFIKKYPNGSFEKFAVLGSIFMAVALIIAKTVLSMLGSFGDMVSSSLFSTNRHSAYMVIMALFVFCAFKKFKIKQNNAVNFLAVQTLGIYLFHESNLFNIADYTYEKIETITALPSSVIIIICTVLLFAAATLVDFIRRKLFDKAVISAVNKTKLCKWIDKTMEI